MADNPVQQRRERRIKTPFKSDQDTFLPSVRTSEPEPLNELFDEEQVLEYDFDTPFTYKGVPLIKPTGSPEGIKLYKPDTERTRRVRPPSVTVREQEISQLEKDFPGIDPYAHAPYEARRQYAPATGSVDQAKWALTLANKTDVEVKHHEPTGRYVWKSKENPQWTPFTGVGFNITDAPEIGYGVGQAIVEGGGAIGMALSRRVGASPLMTGVKAWSGEQIAGVVSDFAKLEYAKSQGAPITDEEYLDYMLTSGGYRGAFSALGPLGVTMWKYLSTLPIPLSIVKNINITELGEALKKARIFNREVKATTGKTLKQSLAQIYNGSKDELLALQKYLQRTQASKQGEELLGGQKEISDTLAERNLGKFAEPEDPIVLAKEIMDYLDTPGQAMEASSESAVKAADSMLRQVVRKMKKRGMDVDVVGRDLNETLVEGRAIIRETLGKEYDAIEDSAKAHTSAADPVFDFANDLDKVLQEQILPSLTKHRSLITQAIRNSAEPLDDKAAQEASEELLGAVKEFDIKIISEHIRAIRAKARGIKYNETNHKVLKGLEESLVAMRDDILTKASTPEKNLVEMIGELDTRYASFYHAFDNKALRNIRKQTGTESVNKILSDPDHVRLINDMANNPDLAHEALKTKEFLQLAALRQFAEGKKPKENVLKELFDGDTTAFKTVRAAEKRLANAETARIAIKEKISKLLGTNVREFEETNIYKHLLNSRPSTAQKIIRELKKDPLLYNQYKGQILQEVKEQIITHTRGGRKIFDPENIRKTILSNKSTRIVFEEMYGKAWVDDMGTLTKILNKVWDEPHPLFHITDEALIKKYGKPKSLKGWFRFLRVLMPPLSPKGRALSATVGVMHDASMDNLSAIMFDPEFLHQLLSAREILSSPKVIGSAQVFVGSIENLWNRVDKELSEEQIKEKSSLRSMMGGLGFDPSP